MTALTIRIDESLARDIDAIARDQHQKRSEVIRQAITQLVHENFKSRERLRLMDLSERVRKESMRVNQEFQSADYEFDHETR